MFASMETCFGLGLIVGPSVGGALYQGRKQLFHAFVDRHIKFGSGLDEFSPTHVQHQFSLVNL